MHQHKQTKNRHERIYINIKLYGNNEEETSIVGRVSDENTHIEQMIEDEQTNKKAKK